MQKKLLVLLFVTTILASSFAASVLPMANALTVRFDFNDRHTTASWGNSRVCGDHVCGPGEKTAWLNKISQLQRQGTGKIGKSTTYQDVLEHIMPTSAPKSIHGNTMSGKIQMGSNMTSAGNMTSTK
jgi:hypothetical protein